jgi:hypothetical protein|tara:strand:- start:3254 stop:3451 length:198 start_codon:yes stop_codon:yes gene_type:complete
MQIWPFFYSLRHIVRTHVAHSPVSIIRQMMARNVAKHPLLKAAKSIVCESFTPVSAVANRLLIGY